MYLISNKYYNYLVAYILYKVYLDVTLVYNYKYYKMKLFIIFYIYNNI